MQNHFNIKASGGIKTKEQAIKIGIERGFKPEFIELEDYYTEPCEEMNNIKKTLILTQEVAKG